MAAPRSPVESMPVGQVEQRKKINPDDIDEVPVKAADFQRRVIFRRESSLPCGPQKPGKNAQTDNHVQRMQAGHYEVQCKENLCVFGIGVLAGMAWNLFVLEAKRWTGNVVLHELVSIFDALDAKECATEKHGQHEHHD